VSSAHMDLNWTSAPVRSVAHPFLFSHSFLFFSIIPIRRASHQGQLCRVIHFVCWPVITQTMNLHER